MSTLALAVEAIRISADYRSELSHTSIWTNWPVRPSGAPAKQPSITRRNTEFGSTQDQSKSSPLIEQQR
jgi:hypothetical protein